MKIKSLEVALFKGFQKSKLSFGQGLNLLVGANNSGKSSLLQAVHLAFYFLSVTKGISPKDKKSKNKLKGVMLKNFPLPLHDNASLSEGRKQRSMRTKTTYVKMEMDNGYAFMERLSFPGGNPLVISSDFDGNQGNLKYRKNISKITEEKQPLFIPLFAGVVNKEEMKTAEVVGYYVSSGKSSEVLRNQLREMPKDKVKILNSYLADSFNVEILFNETHEIYLSSIYKEGEYNNLDISSAGSGFQQILQILVYIVTSDAEIILIDEPDAHLHHKLQNSLYDILLRLVEEGRQIIVATHSQIFIKKAMGNNDHLVLVNKKFEEQKAIDEYDESLKFLYEDGLIDEEEITERKSIKFIFLEDSNGGPGSDIMKKFLGKMGYKGSQYKIENSNGEHDAIIKYLKVAKRVDGIKFKALIFRDSDSIPEEYLDKLRAKHEDENISISYSGGHEIENYLLNSKIISEVIKQKNPESQITPKDIENSINELVEGGKDNLLDVLDATLEGKLGEYHRDVGLEFGKIQSKTREIKKKIREEYMLFPYKKLPGKQIFNRLKQIIHKRRGVSISEIDVARNFKKSDIPEEIKKALEFI